MCNSSFLTVQNIQELHVIFRINSSSLAIRTQSQHPIMRWRKSQRRYNTCINIDYMSLFALQNFVQILYSYHNSNLVTLSENYLFGLLFYLFLLLNAM